MALKASGDGRMSKRPTALFCPTDIAHRWDKTAMIRIHTGEVPDLPPPEGWEERSTVKKNNRHGIPGGGRISRSRITARGEPPTEEELEAGAKAIMVALHKPPQ